MKHFRVSMGLWLLLGLSACGGDSGGGAGDSDADRFAAASVSDGVWMKGDLHLHSHHSSDATSPLAGLVALAEEVGMDYFIITDHDNHVEGRIAEHTWADPDYRSDSMVMLYGAEWTNHRGHGNVIAAQPYEHELLYQVRDDLDVVIGDVIDSLGVHMSACHPAGSDAWNFSYDFARGIEVWNSSIWLLHSGATQIWDDLLKSGRRITGRGGSDAHHGPLGEGDMTSPSAWQSIANVLGTPTTWVFARERSPEAVVEALDVGRASISVNPNAERLALYVDTDGDGQADGMMGDNLPATGQPVTFMLEMVGGDFADISRLYTVTVIKNGEEFGTFTVTESHFEFEDTPAAGDRSYYRVEVQGWPSAYLISPLSPVLSTAMLALSNPVYFNY